MASELTLIGFGEAGSTFARAGDWQQRACGWDLLEDRRQVMTNLGVRVAGNAREAVTSSPLILSLVTADAALAAARDYAAFCNVGTLWCDMNSVAPDTKRAAAAAIEAAGGRYVDAAVMAPVSPAALDVTILLAGPAAEEAEMALATLGFGNLRLAGSEVGQASAIKMIRSVMVKGIEALTAEAMLAAESAGVADAVLASLDDSEKPRPWRERAAYNIERMVTHGLRRAAEMEEAAKTLESLGVEPIMTRGTIRRQREQAGRAIGKDRAE